jgi:chromosome segregation ATPase
MVNASPVTTPVQHSVADYLQMWRNAGEALQRLAKHMTATEDKLHAETRAIATLDQQSRDEAQAIAALEQDIAQTQGEISAAQTTLAVVKGTVAEAETKASIKVFKEHLASLERELEEARANAEASHEHQAADSRQHETRRTEVHAALEELRGKQARFYQEAGNAHYSQIEAELEEMRQHAEKARADLAAKEQELAEAQAQVAQRLNLWPQLKLQARRELLPRELEDEATSVLRAKLAYINALAQDGHIVSREFPGRRVAMDLGIDYPTVLALVGHTAQYDDILRANRNALQALINEHRIELANRLEQAHRSEEKRLLRGY